MIHLIIYFNKICTFTFVGRICDNDNDEYDSDLDDFIDDGLEEDQEDYSKHISEIFGYDKNKYKHIDDEDDTGMESNFAQQLKEEYVSTKIGIYNFDTLYLGHCQLMDLD